MPVKADDTDEQLLEAWRDQGDREALGAFIKRLMPFACSVAHTASAEAAEDAVQDAFIQVMRRASTFRSGARVRPWLARIVINAAAMQTRVEVRTRRRELSAAEMAMRTATPEAALLEAEASLVLEHAVEQLPAEERLPVVLRYQQGMTQNEVAQALSVSERTVARRIERALLGLHRAMAAAGFARTGSAAIIAALASLPGGTVPAPLAAKVYALAGSATFGGTTGATPATVAAKAVAVAIAAAVLAGAAIGLPGILGRTPRGPLHATGGEKLLQGFEEDELAAAALRSGGQTGENSPPFHFEKRGEEICFLADVKGSPQARGDWQQLPLRSSPVRASQGRRALRTRLTGAPLPGTSDGVFWNGQQRRRPAFSGESVQEVFGTYGRAQYFHRLFPTSDWSGYRFLWADVYVERPQSPRTDTALVMIVESRDVDHPVRCLYRVPPDRWCTLELDLDTARDLRGLELERITGLWLRLDSEQRCEGSPKGQTFDIFLDNIRLSPAGAAAPGPVLRDATPLDGQRPAAYAVIPAPAPGKNAEDGDYPDTYVWKLVEPVVPPPAKVPHAPGPTRAERTADIDISVLDAIMVDPATSRITLRGIAAAGADRILVAMDALAASTTRWGGERDNCAVIMSCTTDGGSTWKGLSGGAVVGTAGLTAYGMWSGAAAFDAGGGDMLLLQAYGDHSAGTNGWAEPLDTVFCRRAVVTATGWDLTPFLFSGLRGRRYIHVDDMGRSFAATKLPAGRIWCAHEYDVNRVGESGEVEARFSDDGGASWHGWRGANRSGRLSFKPGCPLAMVPYRDHVMLLGRRGWSAYDGRGWTNLQPIGEGAARPVSAVALRDGTILVSTMEAGVLSFDGAKWVQELAEANAQLSVCGDTVLAFASEGGSLSCRRRTGGRWTERETLVTEAEPVLQLVAQRYAPDDFAPVAYVTGGSRAWPGMNHQIRVLKVPARGAD